ncbi:hypothetical protein [Amycolatopsis alba]|uniref:Uncharacterized protein n=1 Tax=Amycolatopsis alba DSM 44262 TaxID=1125972 RepID=A0A229RBH8_AMYAL|nr:hypothetical protein [Amycolatopsis alba]OXM43774.1 hypothetical protein CFP75_36975 [Amycolatopsis alba DSM 44262]
MGTGHTACVSIGSGPHVHTVAGVGGVGDGDGDGDGHRRDEVGVPSGREVPPVPPAPAVGL